MKKTCLTLAMVAVALTCMLLAIYFLAPGEKIDSGDGTSPYPYSYEIRGEKVKVIITGEFPEGCKWISETADDVLTVKAGRQTAKKATFTLKPQRAGNTSVSFILHQPGDLPDLRFKILSSFLVTDKLDVFVTGSSHQELQGLVGAEAETFSYRIAALSAEEQLVRIYHDPAQTWTYEQVGDKLAVNNGSSVGGAMMRAEDGTYSDLSIVRSKTGVGTLYLSSDAGENVELKYNVGSGAISLTEHRIMGENDVRAEADTAYEDSYGEESQVIGFVLGESDGKVMRWLSRDDNLTTFNVGVSEYELSDNWTVCISRLADEADFAGHEEPVLQVTEGEASANLYAGDFGVRSVWRAGGKTYLLESADASQETAEILTRELMRALA